MTHRRPRRLNDTDVARLMEALLTCRRACNAFHAASPIGGPYYQAASAITVAIDEFATVATGRSDHFHGKFCPAGPGPRAPERKTPGAE